MEIKTRVKNFTLSESTNTYVEEKVGNIAKYLSNIHDAYVELENDAHHKNGAVSHVSITLRVVDGGEVLFAQDTASDMHEAIDRAVSKLKHVIEKYKGTHNQIDKEVLRELHESE
ncbi:MAG: ribosome-associated translation inhibitor RaiA [bacterium]|nr:ribosome-associated translation inhibitor RaiA [bacterium]